VWKRVFRLAYKPHSVQQTIKSRFTSRGISSLRLPGRSSLWGARCRAALAAYPGLAFSPLESAHKVASSLLPSSDGFVPAWPCSRRGLPGHPHYWGCRWSLTPPFHSDLPPEGDRRPVSVALHSGRLTPHGGFPAPGAARRRALWSTDFPRSHAPARNRDRPASLKTPLSYYKSNGIINTVFLKYGYEFGLPFF